MWCQLWYRKRCWNYEDSLTFSYVWYYFVSSYDSALSRSSAGERQGTERCDVTYGDVIDKAARKNVSICRRAKQDGGLSRVYVSQSNLLQIVFTPAASAHRQQQQQHNFIIHVEGNWNAIEIKQVSTVLLRSDCVSWRSMRALNKFW